MRSDAELQQIALDRFHGRIFTSGDCPMDEVPLVFMLLGLMTREQLQELSDAGAVLVYEYLDKAGERSVNGLPMFMSFQWLTQAEFDVVSTHLEALKAAVQEALPGLGSTAPAPTESAVP